MMKECYFRVSQLLVFVAFAMFPMSLEAVPSSEPKQVEVINKSDNPVAVNNVQKPIPIRAYNSYHGTSDTQVAVLVYTVPEGHHFRLTHVSILASLTTILEATKPVAYYSMRKPDQIGNLIPIGIATLSQITLPIPDYPSALLSKLVDIHAEQGEEISFFLHAEPSLIQQMQVSISGYLHPVAP